MIRGMFYFSHKCKKCPMLIWGESEGSEGEAKKDYDRKMNAHHNQEHKFKAKPQLRNKKARHQTTTLFPGKNHRNE